MIQGTGSDVGKSLIVAGLARAFTARGLAVRPFKPQNMSNNAAVTADGGEIGRAQALQARAARVAPSVHMNPVLLKPQSEVGSQVVVQGRMVATVKARDYQAWKPRLLSAVLDSFARLAEDADLVLVEGAGSASEVNLRAGDIANMGFARATDTPVVLVGDIDRGGVIASLVGTKAVIDPEDAALIAGFLVNRFRGDPSLFADGMRLIAEKTGWAALGLVPHFPDAARLPAEDVLGLAGSEARGPGSVTVAVPVLPRIANFDDLDPLRAEPGVSVVLVRPGTPIPAEAALVLLPGSKTTIDDLEAFRQEGWDVDLRAHVRRGGRVLGLCGGYQMLGKSLADPHGIEGAAHGAGPRAPRRRHRDDAGEAPRRRHRREPARRRAVLRLRDAYRRDRGPRHGPAAAAPRRRPPGRGGLGGRARGRDLRPRPVRRRRPAGGLARAPRHPLGGRRLRGRGRGGPRRPRATHRGPCRLRPPPGACPVAGA